MNTTTLSRPTPSRARRGHGRGRTPARLTRGRTGRRRRATVLFEFVLISPLFLFLVLFTIDMGRLMVLYGAVGDATYVAARAEAQYGQRVIGGRDVVNESFQKAVSDIPGLKDSSPKIVSVTPAKCTASSLSKGASYVTVVGTAQIGLITPGLGALLRVANSSSSLNTTKGFAIRTTAVVLCEVIR